LAGSTSSARSLLERPKRSRGQQEPPPPLSAATRLVLRGHGLVGLVLDLHDPAGFLVPLGPPAGLGVVELGAVAPQPLDSLLLGRQFAGPLGRVFAISYGTSLLATAFTSPRVLPQASGVNGMRI
jgi:hypothetical protein